LGNIIIEITCFSIGTFIYRDNVTWVVRYAEMLVGFGLGIGPIIGSAVYEYLSYEGTMYLFAFFDIVALIICFIFIPSFFNQNLEEDEEIQKEERKEIGNAEK